MLPLSIPAIGCVVLSLVGSTFALPELKALNFMLGVAWSTVVVAEVVLLEYVGIVAVIVPMARVVGE